MRIKTDTDLITSWLRRHRGPRRVDPSMRDGPIIRRQRSNLEPTKPEGSASPGEWFVVRTNIKCERKAEQNLRAAGLDVYAPRAFTERFIRRKRIFVTREEMLVPRYLFIRSSEGAVPWRAVRECEGVEHILPANGDPLPLNSVEAKALAQIIEADLNLEFDFTKRGKLHRKEIGRTKKDTTRLIFKRGARVKVKRGPFAEFTAEVEEVTTRGTVEAMVSLFGRLSTVEFPPAWLELDEEAEAA